MSLPGTLTLTEGSCAASSTDTDCYTSQELLCFNPCYALDHEDACGVVSVTALRLEPEDSEVATGRRCAVRVVATFSNGREADVTEEAEIDTENDSVAAVDLPGVGTGGDRGQAGVYRGLRGRGKPTGGISMKKLFPFLATLAVGCGGVSKVAVTDIEFRVGTNVVRIANPKDTTFERLRFNGLEIDGYASAVNAEAIAAARAQAEAQAQVGLGAIRLTDTAMRAMAASKGIQIPPTQAEVPPGWKLVPKDDPSQPHPEIE